MSRDRRVNRTTWSWLSRPRVEDEVSSELAFHVDMTIQALTAAGMSTADARAEAVRRFGDIAVVGTECRRFARQRDRNRSRAEYISELRQDATFALRQLARARGFAATAMLTLALGTGATAAVFSALYAVVLKPLPFFQPDRVVQILPTSEPELGIVSGAEFSAMRERRDVFAEVAGVRYGGGFTLVDGDVPQVIGGLTATANYLRVIGVTPAIGRGFLASDDVPGAPHVALVSHALWRRRFNADTALVGRTLHLNEETYTIVGVLPPSLDVLARNDEIWAPLQLTPEQMSNNRGRWFRVVARLAPKVTLARAADAASRAMRLSARQSSRAAPSEGAIVRRYLDGTVGSARHRLLVLLGAVSFVLLIACVNVANLLLARGAARARELAIRASLGAGRGRIVRQLLAESVVLALGGAAVGVLIAYGLVKGVVALAPEGVHRLDQARVNGVVLAFTFAVAVVTSLVAGLVPALRAATPALQDALREGGRGSVGSGRRDVTRALLVPAEVALAMALLTGSGLLIRTAIQLQRVDPGFQPSHVLTSRVLLPTARYTDAVMPTRAFIQIRDAAARVPGVRRASLVSVVPLSQSYLRTAIAAQGRGATEDDRVNVDIRYCSPDFFGAMGMVLLSGRDFARTDDSTAAPAAIISASLARRLWGSERVLGRRIDAMRIKRDTPNWMTVVGVVSDVHDEGLNLPPRPTLYMPFTQMPAGMWMATGNSMVLVAKTDPPPESMLRALRRAVMSVDPLLPLTDVRTMEDLLSESIATARFNTVLLSILGAIALVLASVGVYGIVGYFVSHSTREIGVRMALGAGPRQIWRLVLDRGLRPIMLGALAGMALSLTTARLLREQLYGVTPQDPLTLAAVVVALFGVGLVATIVPARRAIAVSPARALAAE
jgi:putative ABC transport system permease protein